MEKMAGSPEIADLLDLDRPLAETVRLVAERKSCAIGDVMVVVLDRRARGGIAAIRDAGARVRLIPHGDVSAALLAVTERSPWTCCGESAARPRESSRQPPSSALAGSCWGDCGPRDDAEREAAMTAGYDLDACSRATSSSAGEDVFSPRLA